MLCPNRRIIHKKIIDANAMTDVPLSMICQSTGPDSFDTAMNNALGKQMMVKKMIKLMVSEFVANIILIADRKKLDGY